MARLLARVLVVTLASMVTAFAYSGNHATNPLVEVPDSGQSMSPLYGLKIGVGGSSFGFASGISFSFLEGHHVFTLRLFQSLESITISPRPPEDVLEVGVLYGRVASTKILFASISGGIAFVGGVKRGPLKDEARDQYEKLHRHTLGFPLEIDLAIVPLPFLGVGISLFGNLNVDQSVGGVLVQIQIGKLRPWGSIW